VDQISNSERGRRMGQPLRRRIHPREDARRGAARNSQANAREKIPLAVYFLGLGCSHQPICDSCRASYLRTCHNGLRNDCRVPVNHPLPERNRRPSILGTVTQLQFHAELYRNLRKAIGKELSFAESADLDTLNKEQKKHQVKFWINASANSIVYYIVVWQLLKAIF